MEISTHPRRDERFARTVSRATLVSKELGSAPARSLAGPLYRVVQADRTRTPIRGLGEGDDRDSGGPVNDLAKESRGEPEASP
jgi:hypothetical protein